MFFYKIKNLFIFDITKTDGRHHTTSEHPGINKDHYMGVFFVGKRYDIDVGTTCGTHYLHKI